MSLTEVLSILICIVDKTTTNVNHMSNPLLVDIVHACAGMKLELQRSSELEDAILVSLSKQRLMLSTEHPCGLRDLIFSASLFRTYSCMGKPARFDLHELVSETWLMLADELPQSLTYSTTARLKRSSDEGVGSEGSSPDIHFYAA